MCNVSTFPFSAFITAAVMFVPVQPHEVAGLAPLYWQLYQGMTSNDITPGDWSRAANAMVWVEMRRKGGALLAAKGYEVTMTNTDEMFGTGLLETEEASTRDMARFPRPWQLPLKVELAGALREWHGPVP